MLGVSTFVPGEMIESPLGGKAGHAGLAVQARANLNDVAVERS
jgi:hypothetical protein